MFSGNSLCDSLPNEEGYNMQGKNSSSSEEVDEFLGNNHFNEIAAEELCREFFSE